MRIKSWIIGIICLTVPLIFLGCSAGKQFTDGLAVISGRGGRIAHEDFFEKTVEQANILNKDQPLAQWAFPFNGEGADIISFLDKNRILVGTVESGAMLGVPKHGDIKLMNIRSGDVLWTAGREGLRNGRYLLLLTEPLIIIAGRDDEMSRLTAYDPANGNRKWKHNIKPPDQFLISDTRDKIILFSTQGNGRKVEALDILTGDLIWNSELPSDAFTPDFPDYVVYGQGAVYVSGKTIFKLSEKDGSILWSKGHPVLNTKDRFFSLTAEGLLIYNSKEMSLTHRDNGEVRWDASSQDYININYTILDHKVYRVTAGINSEGEALDDHYIQALKPEDGSVLWSTQIKGEVVSPLCLEQSILVFTTNEGIYGLNAKTGKTQFYNTFSDEFVSGSPAKATTIKWPDMIRFRSGKIYIAREMVGISIYDFPSGNPLGEQWHYNFSSRAYSIDRVYSYMEGLCLSKTSDPAAIPMVPSTRTPSNSFMQSAQRQYEDMRERTRAVLSDSSSTSAERAAAIQERAMGASLMESQMKVSMAMEQMQASADLAITAVGLAAAIQSTYAQTAHRGMISREYMFMNSVMALPSAAFQGNYYIWPFREKDRGVTLIDLETGNRNDLIFSPYLYVLDAYGVNLPNFALGPEGKTLVLAGLGVDPEKYKKHTKWKTSFPKTSILAYDVSSFDFKKKSLTQIRAEERAIQMQQLVQEIQETDKIHTAAQMGNMDMVKSLLDSGVDVNARNYDGSGTPLVFALIGNQAEMVKFLISRGANVNERFKDGKSVLDWAPNEEIKKILKDAGAK